MEYITIQQASEKWEIKNPDRTFFSVLSGFLIGMRDYLLKGL